MLKKSFMIGLLLTISMCHAARFYIDNKTNEDIKVKIQFVFLDNPKMFNQLKANIRAGETATIREPNNQKLRALKIGPSGNSKRGYTTVHTVTDHSADYFTIVKPEIGRYDVHEGRYTPCH